MAEIHFGLVGYGNIGRTYADLLSNHGVDRARLTAVVSQQPIKLAESVAHFDSVNKLLDAGTTDAIIVATPTMTHPKLGIAVMNAGHHLVMEKPLGMSVFQAQQLIDAQPKHLTAAVMLNQRHHPAYEKIKAILSEGTLGHLVRFSWIMTTWYRPDVYFQVSSWRGTWPGEGGGALMNQCIHNLDILYWLLGLPESVMAQAGFGKFHAIDVEDEVSALLTYPQGLSGTLVASTGEAPGSNRLEIVGDRGTLCYDDETLTLTQVDSVAEHCATTRELFGTPDSHETKVQLDPPTNQHARVLSNVTRVLIDSIELDTPLVEGMGSIHLANAILLSAWEDRRIHLPIDTAHYQQQLDARSADQPLRTPQQIDVHIDMDASYR